MARYYHNDMVVTNQMIDEQGIEVTHLNDADWQTIRETCKETYEEECGVHLVNALADTFEQFHSSTSLVHFRNRNVCQRGGIIC